jgi:hypothetical protein
MVWVVLVSGVKKLGILLDFGKFGTKCSILERKTSILGTILYTQSGIFVADILAVYYAAVIITHFAFPLLIACGQPNDTI